jgi:hypothetical protein
MPKFELKLSAEAQREAIAEANPLIGTKKYLDEQRGTVEYPVLLRDPVGAAERQKVREVWAKNLDHVRRRLAKKDCPRCHGKGSYDVYDYPGDPIYYRLTSSEICGCFMED